MSKKKANKGKQTKFEYKNWAIFIVCALVLVGAGILISTQDKDKKENKKEEASPEVEQKVEEYDPLEYVQLGEYVGVHVSMKVTKAEIQSEIDSLLEEHAVYEQLPGVVQDGDMVYADFEGYVNGVKMDDTCGSDYIEIGSGEWLDGFETSLIGRSTGETAIFALSVPEGTYGDPSIDGQTVEFHVMIQYLCGDQILPEYNDAFVQSISKKYKTTKEYEKHIRKRLEKDNEEQKAEYVWSEVMDGSVVINYPETLLQASSQEVLQGYYDMAEVYGTTREEIFPAFGYTDEQEFVNGDLPELAQDTAKEYLVSQAIAQKEGISYTQEEYEEFREEEYSYQDGAYDTMEEFEADRKAYLENQMLLRRVKDWLAERAEFTY